MSGEPGAGRTQQGRTQQGPGPAEPPGGTAPADTGRPAAPSWIRELDMALTVYPQVLLTGNVRDQYLLPDDHAAGSSPTLAPYTLDDVIESVCLTRGYGALAVQDQLMERIALRRLTLEPFEVPEVVRELSERDARWQREQDGDDDEPSMTDRLRDVMVGIVRHPGPPIGLIIPYAARLGSSRAPVGGEAARLFATAEELGHTARPVQGKTPVTPYNTVFWVVERQEDLPLDFAVGSRALRVISVPQPPHDQRLAVARYVVGGLARRQAAIIGPRRSRACTLAWAPVCERAAAASSYSRWKS
ncbi:ATP-dependent Clp protease ATP-binding subunit, partial [Kitasatospora sp. NPDC047058]